MDKGNRQATVHGIAELDIAEQLTLLLFFSHSLRNFPNKVHFSIIDNFKLKKRILRILLKYFYFLDELFKQQIHSSLNQEILHCNHMNLLFL